MSFQRVTQRNIIEEMNKIILQPSGSSDAHQHYFDTIENRIDLELIEEYVSKNDFLNLSEIYQGQPCMVWGVTPGGSNSTKWNRINIRSIYKSL